jgi:hypothetical protein
MEALQGMGDYYIQSDGLLILLYAILCIIWFIAFSLISYLKTADAHLLHFIYLCIATITYRDGKMLSHEISIGEIWKIITAAYFLLLLYELNIRKKIARMLAKIKPLKNILRTIGYFIIWSIVKKD